MGEQAEEKKLQKPTKHICAGLLAHVDAGKTTLSEAMLYEAGEIRSLGRVDHQNAYLDTDLQERERGITIFSKQARLELENKIRITLLDTPGHVDFSAEMERALQVLDYAVLVVSATDGVQGHTRTLWRLLAHYQVPVFVFVNKMDLDGADREAVLKQLQELSDGCVDFSSPSGRQEFYEDLAVCDEALLDEYMESGSIENRQIAKAIAERKVFPCFCGSALKLEGVRELLDGLAEYTRMPEYPKEFAARVYKIGRDSRGVRLTYLKVTGGELRVKERIRYAEAGSLQTLPGQEQAVREEKADQLRLYSGDRYETVDAVPAGEVCAVTGLTATWPGQGLGAEAGVCVPVLEPVLCYQIHLPKEANPAEMMGKLRELEEEDPQLHIVWDEQLQEIHAQVMGQVQTEVLTRLIRERFGVAVVFGQGSIVYKETVAAPVEGIGHFEPLRHYAEVHLLLEPGEPGSGVQVATVCSEDVLDLNWQRLIATHVTEREHPGVLTGAPLTDVKVTILTGRAHIKHTEGGDFRQATYRAIRQGLKSGGCVLLEPFYRFTLAVPQDAVGRAMTDLRQRAGQFDAPQFTAGVPGEMAILQGTAPVASMQDYMSEVHAYTKGLGQLTLELAGYDVCHNSGEVIAAKGYDSEADTANPTGSVFCAHGGGFLVPWDEVENYMHLERVYVPGAFGKASDGNAYRTDGANYRADEADALTGARRQGSWEKSVAKMSACELDKELADVYEREFGMSRADVEHERRKWSKSGKKPKAPVTKLDKKGNPIYPSNGPAERMLVVDGYNIIFAWKELNELSRVNIDSARDRLKDLLLNYQAYVGCRLVVVFDAYKVRDNAGRHEIYDGRSRGSKKEAALVKKASVPPKKGAVSGREVSVLPKKGAASGREVSVPPKKGAASGREVSVPPEKASVKQTPAPKKGAASGKEVSAPPKGTSASGKAANAGAEIEVVYTRTDETADAYIERMVHGERGRYRITVATNDSLEQLTVMSQGALRMSAENLREEIARAGQQGFEAWKSFNP